MIYNQPAEEIIKNTLKPFRIAWLFPEEELEKNPSDRLRRFQISRFININVIARNGSVNIFGYARIPDLKEKLEDVDIIVLLNIGEIDLDLCRYFRAKGKIILFDHCERIFGLASEDQVMQEVSAITCCSTALARTTDNYLKSRGIDQKIFVIRDPIDDDILVRDSVYLREENTALIMGMGANVQYVLPRLEEACTTAGYKIKIISEAGFSFPGHEFHIWEPDYRSDEYWIEHASKCSVALCCHDEFKFPDKGNVKVTMPMALGLPVIASPIESYKEAIRNGNNGFIVENNDWVTPLNALKDLGLSYIMGFRSQYTAKSFYSTEKIGLDYVSMIQELQA